MRVLIVDDEAPARDKLARMLAAFPDVQLVGSAADGYAALELASRLAPDAIFLDVQMPEVSGLEVAASLPEGESALVFVTAYDRYAIQAFDAGAVDYLLKPVEPERLERTLSRLRAHGAAARPRTGSIRQLLVADRGQLHVVRVDEIEWLEAADNYVTLHAAGRDWLMRRTLSGLLEDLGSGFVRVHRSAAVALGHVRSVQSRGKGDATIVLRSGAEVACSRQFRSELIERLPR